MMKIQLIEGEEEMQKNILCVAWMNHLSIKIKSLWPIEMGRIEGGTANRKKGFWERARYRGFASEHRLE